MVAMTNQTQASQWDRRKKVHMSRAKMRPEVNTVFRGWDGHKDHRGIECTESTYVSLCEKRKVHWNEKFAKTI